MGDPFASIAPFCEVSSSQDFPLFPRAAGEDSQESESSGSLRVEPTGICMVSPPETPESPKAKDGTPSRDDFETPVEAVPAASSEERWFGCDGETSFVGAGDGKTVDLDRDTDLGFSETEMAQQTVAELESGDPIPIGGRESVQVELPESELTGFLKWKRKLIFRARLLEELPAKQLVREKSSNFDPQARAGAGIRIVEEKISDNMVKPMKDLKSCSVIPRLEPPESLQVKGQMLMKLNECTQVVSLDSEAVMAKNGLESNDGTQAVRLVSGGKGLISESRMTMNGLGSHDVTEVADAEVSKIGPDSKDHTEVVGLGSGEKGLVSDQGIAKNGLESNHLTQMVMLDLEHNHLVSDEDTAKLGLAQDESTEEIVIDSDDEGLVTDEDIAKHGLALDDPTEVDEDDGLVSGAGLAKKGPALNYGAEKVDNTPNAGKAETLLHKGEGIGGLKNIEDIDAPSSSDSSERPKSARVLPITMQAEEGDDSSKNPPMDLLSSALRNLPKTHPDPGFEDLSLLEIAKHSGITFLRPSWWVEEEEEEEED